ncbi:MAG: hypothetical protein Q8P31_08210 [Bacillota bacterium]|nr:hypothetical protein [Bacillota bacterium]
MAAKPRACPRNFAGEPGGGGRCCTTVNLYDRIYAMRGDRVEAIWRVAARGRSD